MAAAPAVSFAAVVLSALTVARLLGPDAFVLSQGARLTLRTDARRFESFRAQLDQAPWDGVSREAAFANGQAFYLAYEVLNGRRAAAEAAPLAARCAERDADNALTHWCAAWIESRRRRDQGADAAAQAESLARAAGATAGLSRATLYEREATARERSVWSRYVRGARPELPVLLSDDDPPATAVAALPAIITDLNRLADECGDARRGIMLRAAAARLLTRWLRNEPSVPAAMLAAELLALTADRAAAASGRRADGPASTAAASQSNDAAANAATAKSGAFAHPPAGPDWWAIADEARRFRSDCKLAILRRPRDLLFQQPIAADGYYAVWAWLLAAVLLTIGGLAAGLGGWGRAAFEFAMSRRGGPIAADLAPRGRIWLAAVVVALPAIATACQFHSALAAHGLTCVTWPWLAGAAALAATAAVAHVMTEWAVLPTGRRLDRAALAIAALGALLTLCALSPSAWYGRADYAARAHPFGFAGLFVLFVIAAGGAALLGIRARLRDDLQPSAPRPRALSYASVAATTWLLSAGLGFAACLWHAALDRRAADQIAREQGRIEALVGTDWLDRYFAAAQQAG